MPEPAPQGPGPVSVPDRLVRWLTLFADQMAAAICFFLIVATTAAVIVYQRGITIVWLDDLLRMLLIWLVYVGSVSLCFHNDHIAMDAIYLRLPRPARRVIDVIVAVTGIVLCSYIAKFGFDSMRQEIAYGMLLASGYLPSWPQTLAIPLCFALMALAYLSFLIASLADGRRRDNRSSMVEGV